MEELRQLLLAASSQDPRGLAGAEQQLKILEIQPGFHAALLVNSPFLVESGDFSSNVTPPFQSAASDRELNSGARLQAILYLKNGIDKYWRKMAPK